MALVLKSIRFNTDGDAALGSLHCRKDSNIPINPTASAAGSGAIAPVGVFVPEWLSTSITIYIEVENTSGEDIDAVITAKEINTPAVLGEIVFNVTKFNKNSKTTIETAWNMAHIKSLHKKTQYLDRTWKWEYTVTGASVNQKMTQTIQKLYLIHDLPREPWKSSPETYSDKNIYYVWTDLLDICCAACNEYETIISKRPETADEHMAAFTRKLNGSPAFNYDVKEGKCFYTLWNGNEKRIVKLQKYIRDHNNHSSKKELNCTDCATLVQIESRACGIEATGVHMEKSTAEYFATNPVVSIGYADWQKPFGRGFGYHEMASSSSALRNKDTPIYDACLQLDEGPRPSSVTAKTAFVPIGTKYSETGLNPVNVPATTDYSKIFYKERLVTHGESCDFSSFIIKVVTIDPVLTFEKEVKMEDDFRNLKAKFNLAENPLPKYGIYKSWQKPNQIFSKINSQSYEQVENYVRNLVYELRIDENVYRVELTFALNENEAYWLLINKLNGIANPNIKQVESTEETLGDISYSIGNGYFLFVKNNVLVEVSGKSGNTADVAFLLSESLND